MARIELLLPLSCFIVVFSVALTARAGKVIGDILA
jgi:hypothetical protein